MSQKRCLHQIYDQEFQWFVSEFAQVKKEFQSLHKMVSQLQATLYDVLFTIQRTQLDLEADTESFSDEIDILPEEVNIRNPTFLDLYAQ